MENLGFFYACEGVTGFLLSAIVQDDGRFRTKTIFEDYVISAPSASVLLYALTVRLVTCTFHNGPTYHPRS